MTIIVSFRQDSYLLTAVRTAGAAVCKTYLILNGAIYCTPNNFHIYNYNKTQNWYIHPTQSTLISRVDPGIV